MLRYFLFTTTFFLLFGCSETDTHFTSIQWEHQFSKATFEKAKSEDKLVLLTLEANWCHWCHVMEDSTYSLQEVIDYVNAHFICVAVDQDANPELASRYRKYGWPATIILNQKGEDLVKRAGFMSPKEYLQVLKEAVSGESVIASEEPLGKVAQSKVVFKKRLETDFTGFLNLQKGAFQSGMVYVEEESVEYARFYKPTEQHRSWIKTSITNAYALCDSVWGGVYQYSTNEDWNHPHYEKLLHIQARYMRLFLSDYGYTENVNSLKKAIEIQAYCSRFLLNKQGLYSNAQDADLKKGTKADDYFLLNNKARLKFGIPAIDTNTYTHTNADYATALLKLFAVNNQQSVLDGYYKIVNQLIKRKNTKGLFNHSYQSKKTDALRDNLAMSKLLIEHVKIFPQDIKMKQNLASLMKAIVREFKLPNGSFKGFSGELGLTPEPIIEENIPLARLLNWYAGFSGKAIYKKYANEILNYLLKLDVKKEFFHEPGILMLLNDLEKEAQHHVSVNENQSLEMMRIAYAFAPFYSYFDVCRTGQGGVYAEQFSGVEGANLFICSSSYCSSPLKDVGEVKAIFKK